MTRLTSRQATAAGYTLARTDTGRTRVMGPDGTKYAPCSPDRAQLVIEPATAGILPLTLRATEFPPALLLALTERRQA